MHQQKRPKDASAAPLQDFVQLLHDQSGSLNSLVLGSSLINDVLITSATSNTSATSSDQILLKQLFQALSKCHALERVTVVLKLGYDVEDEEHEEDDDITEAEKKDTIASDEVLPMLFATLGQLPSLTCLELENVGRVLLQLPVSWLTPIILRSKKNAVPLESLSLTGCGIPRLDFANTDNSSGSDSSSNSSNNNNNVLLKYLTLKNCRFDASVEEDGNDAERTKLLGLLTFSTHLESLVLEGICMNSKYFSCLPKIFAQNDSSLTKLAITTYGNGSINGKDMFILLEAVVQCHSLQEISIPALVVPWNDSLLLKLAAALVSGKDRFRIVDLNFTAIPAASRLSTQLAEGIHQGRNQAWSIMKDFLVSCNTLQEVGTSNFTETELLELVDVLLQQQQRQTWICSWKKLRIASTGIFVSTVEQVIRRLSRAQATTPSLKVAFNCSLFQGEEYMKSKDGSQLAQTFANNYLVNELTLMTSYYSPSPHTNLMEFPEKGKESKDAIILRSSLDLNQAGRRYMLQDISNKTKGVAVLAEVADNVDAIFMHLRENPILCKPHQCQNTTTEHRLDLHGAGSKHRISDVGDHRVEKRKCSDCFRFCSTTTSDFLLVTEGPALCCCTA